MNQRDYEQVLKTFEMGYRYTKELLQLFQEQEAEKAKEGISFLCFGDLLIECRNYEQLIDVIEQGLRKLIFDRDRGKIEESKVYEALLRIRDRLSDDLEVNNDDDEEDESQMDLDVLW